MPKDKDPERERLLRAVEETLHHTERHAVERLIRSLAGNCHCDFCNAANAVLAYDAAHPEEDK